jgi:hypothetical protein
MLTGGSFFEPSESARPKSINFTLSINKQTGFIR